MEAVPRLHMLWFALKSSPEGTSFANLKKYIAEFYHEDPESYSKEVFALETLRNQAMHPTKDGCKVMKRYYCQLHSLQNRFPQLSESDMFTFTWKDLYQSNIQEVTDLRYEMAAVLFNIAASHTQVGASVTRGDGDGMKVACTHFQCAAWAFGELRERYANMNSGTDFMTSELLEFMQQVSFAQAQECILEKSLIDNRKPNIVAKVTAQIIAYYCVALSALLTGGDDGPIGQIIDTTIYRLWKKYVRFKISYLSCILYLYQGQHAEEQQKMGERVTLYQAAWEKLEDARKESKGLPDQNEINESLVFTADVVEAKRKNAKNENEFIYHEAVPELTTITAVQGANLVNGSSFAVTDPEVAGDDIFARLVPMKAHEASSMYSEEKSKLLRKYGAMIEERDIEIMTFMNSLALDNLNINEEKANKIPQGIVDRCAALNASKTAIPDLIAAMSHLAEICADVEMNIKEIGIILTEEERQEHDFQTLTGLKRTPNSHITELTREYQKYSDAHIRAGESNDTLRKAMELHVNNLKMLARPLQEIQQSVPKLSTELNTNEIFKDVKLIVNKVNEMRAQRSQFYADLRIAVNDDDITAKVIAHGTDEGLQSLFDRELAKHERLTQLLDQNLLAQKNILQALTESYAKAAPVLKTLADVKHKRETFFSSLAASYDVYEDLLAKSAKGLEFYKKLSGNVQKLYARLKSAHDVQSEERLQRIENVTASVESLSKDNVNTMSSSSVGYLATTVSISTTPKLRDYLRVKDTIATSVATASKFDGLNSSISSLTSSSSIMAPYVPLIRPNPLGSENPTQAICSGNYANAAAAPNEPPPPYSLQQAQYYDSNSFGYTNPMYQQQQQHHIAPPVYTMQASPNSQFTNMQFGMVNLTLQQEQQKPSQQQSYQSIQTHSNDNAHVSSQHDPPLYSQHDDGGDGYDLNTGDMHPKHNYHHKDMIGTTNVETNDQYMAHAHLSVQKYQQQQLLLSQQQLQTPPQPQEQYRLSSETAPQQQPIITQSLYIPSIQTNDAIHTLNTSYMDKSKQQNADIPIASNTLTPAYPSNNMNSSASVPTVTGTKTNTTTLLMPNTGFQTNSSTGKHPGYSFNPQTGIYEYGSGYQQGAAMNTNFYGQYTTVSAMASKPTVGTTDSQQAKKITLSTGFDSPVISHTAAIGPHSPSATDPSSLELRASGGAYLNYYTPPYGYYTNANVSTSSTAYETPVQELKLPRHPQLQLSQWQTEQQHIQQQQTIYMQSGSTSQANTQTTKSAADYASSAQQAFSYPMEHQQQIQQGLPTATFDLTVSKKTSNIDLLTDVGVIGEELNALPHLLTIPILQPEVVASPPNSEIAASTRKLTADEQPQPLEQQNSGKTTSISIELSTPKETPIAVRKVSWDNLSISSDLNSLDNNFEWDSTSMCGERFATTGTITNKLSNATFQFNPNDPFVNEKTLQYFHKEVERFEKIIEGLNVKMLNGNTQLSAKWKELHDLLAKDVSKHTTTIAKLFPEKNRSVDCLPYDHARVKLEKNTDDYINAAYVKNLSPGCPNFIITQTPQQNTLNDFWSMNWSQSSRTIVCLHTPKEMLDPFWPMELENAVNFDDYTLKCVQVKSLSHCMQYDLKLSMHGADPIIDLTLLQIKTWNKSSPSQTLGIAGNALLAHQQRCLQFNTPTSPLVLNCINGSERSGLIALALCTVVATQTNRPVLINVIDVWYRICSQRQQAIRDMSTLEESLQIVLSHAHDVLNKHGIITSYQMKIAPKVATKEKQEHKDPFTDLDVLWKLK